MGFIWVFSDEAKNKRKSSAATDFSTATRNKRNTTKKHSAIVFSLVPDVGDNMKLHQPLSSALN